MVGKLKLLKCCGEEMIRKIVMNLFLCCLCFISCAAQDYFANPSKNLFVNDDQIELMEHVTRTLHTPVFNAANPVLPPEKPWEGSVILQPGTVIYDEEDHIFKMWYNSLATRSKPDIHEFVCYATSTDGIHWTRPDLGLVEFHGSKDNNIVLQWTSWTLSVIKDAYASDPSRRYKLAYWNNYDRETKGMWVAFSPDGIHWSPEEHNPVVPMTASGDTFSVMQDPATHKFWLYHKSVIMPIRKVSRFVSDDFVHWKDDEHCAGTRWDETSPIQSFMGFPLFRTEISILDSYGCFTLIRNSWMFNWYPVAMARPGIEVFIGACFSH